MSVKTREEEEIKVEMAASALTTATAAALTSTLPENAPKSNQQSPRHAATTSTVAVRAGAVEVSKALQDGEKFIKWDEVSAVSFFSLVYLVLSCIKGLRVLDSSLWAILNEKKKAKKSPFTSER